MGKKQNNLAKIFKYLGLVVIACPKYNDVMSSKYADEVFNVYKELGGVLSIFPLRLGKWDIEVDGIAIELDEDLHFNRYRKLTLSSNIYNYLPSFPLKEYKNYCDEYAIKCLEKGKSGKRWTSTNCEKQFGKASPKGNLSGNGSPRWKQRAFYDFVKDLSPLIIGVPVARISIWDEIIYNEQKVLIKDILENDVNAFDAGKIIYDMCKKRAMKFKFK